jgi:putative holliday junction resolvase
MELRRTMGLDLGDATIGVAVSDALGMTAQGITTLTRRGGQGDLDALRELCQTHEVSRVVVGLPRNMNGSEGPRAEKSRRFGALLKEALALPVYLWDERLSSAEAERVLISADVSRRKRSQVIDKLAAQILLQSFLDAGGPEVDPA